MRTKKITLFYTITPKQVIPPPLEAVKRKDDWLRAVQMEVPAEWRPTMIRVEYKIHNPEVEQQRKFFNGPVVEYWLIQKAEILEGRPGTGEITRARETLLSNALGYEVELIDRKEKRRKSTSEFTDTQEWHDFLETLRETEFEPNGFEMPNSEAFWEMAKKVGYDKAKDVIIEQLQDRVKKRLSTPGDK